MSDSYAMQNAIPKWDAKPTQLEHAIAWLGDHYVFHKDNKVKKFKRPVPLCSDPRFLIERLKGRL